MTQDYKHPITPPPELVEQWLREWNTLGVRHANPVKSTSYVAIEAARWGADQELEACCDAITKSHAYGVQDAEWLRDARRPKPPSLKQRALEALELVESDLGMGEETDTIRRALEQLDD